MAFTFAATSASGGTFTGFPSLIYTHGWILALWIASYMVMSITTMGVMGKRINQVARRTGAITIPDVLRDRFQSTGVGLFGTCTIIFFTVCNLVGQFRAGSIILQTTFNFPSTWGTFFGISNAYLVALVLFAAIVIFYTAYGGFRAVVWTDVMQGIVMGMGILLLLPMVLYKSGGLNQAMENIRNERPLIVTSLPGTNNDLTFFLNEAKKDPPVGIEFRIPDEQLSKPLVVLKEVDKQQLWIQINPVVDKDGHVLTTANQVKQAVLAPNSPARPYLYIDKEHIGIENANGNNGTGVWRRDADGPKKIQYRFIYGDEFMFGPGRRASGAPFHTFGMVISFFFMWAISGMGQPGTMVRLMAFKESRTLKRAIITVTIYYAVIYLPLVFIFVAGRTLLPGYIPQEDSDKAMALIATRVIAEGVLTSILAAILVAAPFAAVMSTVDSFLLLVSSSLVRDVYQRTINPDVSQKVVKLASYITTVVVGLIVTFLAIRKIDFLQNIIVFTGAGFASTFLWPMLLGLYWKGMTRQGAKAAMVGGFCIIVSLFLPTLLGGNWINLCGFHPVFWGLTGSFVLGVVVSKLTGPPPEELVDLYFRVPRKPDNH